MLNEEDLLSTPWSVDVAPVCTNVLAVPRCEGPEDSRCIVCQLELAIRRAPETAWAAEAAVPNPEPLHLNVIGLRRENSLSDKFDDALAACFTLPRPDQFDAVKSRLKEMLEPLEKAAGKETKRSRVVHCSRHGAWVVGFFTITTDPGLAARKSDIAHAGKQLEDARAVKDEVQKLEQDEIPAATQEFADTSKALEEESKRRPRDGGALAKAKTAFEKANLRLKTANARHKKLGTLKAADKSISDLEKQKKSLEDRYAELQKQKEDGSADKEEALEVTTEDGPGLLVEGRAMIPAGFYPRAYRFGTHRETDLINGHPALRVGSMLGLRVYSVKHVLAHPADFVDTLRVRQITRDGKVTDHKQKPVTVEIYGTDDPKKREVVLDGEVLGEKDVLLTADNPKPVTVGTLQQADPRKPRIVLRTKTAEGEVTKYSGSPQARLVLTRSGSNVQAWLELGGDRKQLADTTQIQLQAPIAGTNIHRAHNTKISGGELEADGRSTRVANWSEGCQTFPEFSEFNLFIRMAAVSKRWHCTTTDQDCQRVVGGGSAGSPADGEPIVVPTIATPLEAAADDAFVEKDKAKKDDLRALRRLRAKARRSRTEEDNLTDLESKHAEWMADDDWKKKRDEFLWKRTKRLEADWIRICDLGARCPENFDYTLLELAPPHLDRLIAAFEAEPGAAWDGKLVP